MRGRAGADVDRPAGLDREGDERLGLSVEEVEALERGVELERDRAGVACAAQLLERLWPEPGRRDRVGEQAAAGGRGRARGELVPLTVSHG